MLKTYRIIPLVFILFFFGFPLSTVSPVIAEASPEFVACQQIKPRGDFRLMKQKKNCFRDVARLYQVASVNSAVTPSDPSGGEVAELNAKISGLEAGLTELKGVVRALQEQSKNSMQPVALTHRHRWMEAKIKCLELHIAKRPKPSYCFKGFASFQDSLFDGL